jgi:hypothetical protein
VTREWIVRLGRLLVFSLALLLVPPAFAQGAGDADLAELTAPRAYTSSGQVRFEWTAIPGAQAYYLWVGTQPDGRDLVDTGEIQRTSHTWAGAQAGQHLFVALHTLNGGVWRARHYEIEVHELAQISTPARDGSMLMPATALAWDDVPTAQAYYLYVGTTPGAKDLLNSGETQATSARITALPRGVPLHARLFTLSAGVWRYTERHFVIAPAALLTAPAADHALLEPLSRIQWDTVSDADAYFLTVGTSPGARDLINSGEIQATSYSTQALPRGIDLHARLYTLSAGVWRYVDRVFQVAPKATFLGLTDGQEWDIHTPLSWTPIAGAQAYYLWLGTSPRSSDLLNSGETQATSRAIAQLPVGAIVHATLHTKVGGVWRSVQLSFVTRPVAYLSPSLVQAGFVSNGDSLQWNAVPGATRYTVWLGSAPGLRDVYRSREISGTQQLLRAPGIAALDEDRVLYVRLHTLAGGVWRSVDYVLQWRARDLPVLPVSWSEVDVSRVSFSWGGASSADAWHFVLGTTPGSDDVLDSGILAEPRFEAMTLPAGATLYARLWTRVGEDWRGYDFPLHTRAVAPLLHPLHGETGVAENLLVSWGVVPGAQAYRLKIGTTHGGADVFDGSAQAATEAEVIGLPPDTDLFVRVWALVADEWRASDSIVSTRQAAVPASMAWDTDPLLFDAASGLRWNTSALAQHYRLTLGTAPGSSDLLDTGLILTARRLLADLPVGTVLHGRLETGFIDGSSGAEDFVLTVADANVDTADRMALVRELTAFVRSQAGAADSLPIRESLLYPLVRDRSKDLANCVDYAQALLQAIAQSAIGLDARELNVCLNPNDYDCHTLVEVRQPGLDEWALFDPTFGITVLRADTQEQATAEDMFVALHAGAFGDVDYVPLDSRANDILQNYYLDYPLLYANVYLPSREAGFSLQAPDILGFYESLGTAPVAAAGLYAVRCAQGGSFVADIHGGGWPDAGNGNVLVTCEPGQDGLSRIFPAQSLAPAPDGPSFEVFRARRYVFD